MIPGDGLMNGTSDSFDILYPMVYNISNTIDDDTLNKSCDYTQLEKHRTNMDVKKDFIRKFDPTSLRDATQRTGGPILPCVINLLRYIFI